MYYQVFRCSWFDKTSFNFVKLVTWSLICSWQNLHDLGARKVALYGLGPIGCEPSQVKPLRLAGKPGCVDSVNHIISLYNQRLPAIIDEHNKVLPGAKFIFINNSHISPGDNPARIGNKHVISSPEIYTLHFFLLYLLKNILHENCACMIIDIS